MTKIEKNIKELLPKHFIFRPTRMFYIAIHIGQKRFWQLFRGEKSPTLEEIKSISDYFKVPLEEFLPIKFNLKTNSNLSKNKFQ